MSDPLQGTPGFIAIELEKKRFFFSPKRSLDELLSVDVSKISVKHHSLHDAESLWWCLIWILRRHFAFCSPTDRLEYFFGWDRWFTYFPHDVWEQWKFAHSWHRELVSNFEKFEKHLPESLFSPALEGAHDHVASWIDQHRETYPAAVTNALPRYVEYLEAVSEDLNVIQST